MELTDSWPHLKDFCNLAANYPDVQVWLFGSALRSASPSDLDVLLLYRNREDVVAIRTAQWWHHFEPPLHIVAMTAEEERHYSFIAITKAARLY